MTGRSRGRARTTTKTEPTPLTGAPTQSTPTTTVTPPTVSAAAAGQQTAPARVASPSRAEGGRGRGLASTESPAVPAISTSSITSSVEASGGHSPTGSEESPPQQHSPPQSTTTQPSVGRASLRGAPHQPGAAIRTEIIGPLERLALQESGDVSAKPPRREFRYESVLYTKPEKCTDKTGSSGEKIKILCNYFEILNQPNWILYQYHVDFAPVVESKRFRIGLLKPHDHLFPTNKAFDGSTLYSLTKLPDEITEVSSRRETDQAIIVIKIKRIGEIVPTSPNFVHLFNLVFRRCLKKYGMQQIDRNYYDMNKRIRIEQYGLDLINGFSTAISTYENKLLLCAELTHKLLHTNTIYTLMKNIFQSCKGNNDFRESCTNELVGRIVMTKYNYKTYKIDEIDWKSNPTSTFQTARGPTTFVDYYKSHYDLAIMDKQQPLLMSLPNARDKRRGQTTPFLLIPELCIVTGVDEKMRQDFRFKKAVEQFSKVGASDRCQRLEEFIDRFKNHQEVKQELGQWQIDLSTRSAEIVGRVLPFEVLAFGQNIKKQLNEKADWSNDMKGIPLLSTIYLKNWVVIFPQSKKPTASQFIMTFGDIIGPMKIVAERPVEYALQYDNPDGIVNALKQVITDQTQMVVVLVTTKRKDRYDAIKRICCLERPVPSQVVTTGIIEDDKKRKSVVTKVAIQMNCKLGGEIWQTNIPIKDLMICGIDTYHDSEKKKASVCAFIATSNKEQTKYFSRATIQETHQELSSNLTLTVKSACEHYHRVNNVYPAKIIIYRDGVSDGQLSLVLDHEIPQIQKAFAAINPDYRPLMTVIVVKKRGNSRFFAQFGQQNIGNPPCGTVIDTVVTRAEWLDFYLISQNVTQGTVNPTHYNIIYDDIGLKTDHYQKLSYKLTHMYYNWPGTIRVPATCQYAHKLAFLVGQSLHREHHSSLSDKLFYL